MIDPVDTFAMVAFLSLGVGLPVLGWFFMVVDYRDYLRSLRRALAVVSSYYRVRPQWVHEEQWLPNRPECLLALDLNLPCTREEVLAAYRVRVKEVHPDHGGNRKQFDRLQKHLEEALALVEATQAQQMVL